jgi:Leucine-rich repeat (LRR) protein
VLRSIEITNCKLEIIEDDAFSSIKKLTSFNSMGNCLKTLEKRSFSQLNNLEELYLRNNRIESIEWDMFSNMKKLRVLDLVSNNFPKLDPQTLNRLRNLEKLEL